MRCVNGEFCHRANQDFDEDGIMITIMMTTRRGRVRCISPMLENFETALVVCPDFYLDNVFFHVSMASGE